MLCMFLSMNFGMKVPSKQMPKIIKPLDKNVLLEPDGFIRSSLVSNSLGILLSSDYLTKIRLESLKNIFKKGQVV